MITRPIAIIACCLLIAFTVLLLTVDFVIDSPNYVSLLKLNVLFANSHLLWLFMHHAFIDPCPDHACGNARRKVQNGNKRILPAKRISLDGGNGHGKAVRNVASIKTADGICGDRLDVKCEHGESPLRQQQNAPDNRVVPDSGSSDGSWTDDGGEQRRYALNLAKHQVIGTLRRQIERLSRDDVVLQGFCSRIPPDPLEPTPGTRVVNYFQDGDDRFFIAWGPIYPTKVFDSRSKKNRDIEQNQPEQE